ncbi:hypothetical protein F383_27256 [Gossypium arboreum]|uniref:Uncharacterized protein n=1 Tax=Gossypium arboreum TaxID=29729 RepID=A0A0B0PAM6_GOSAR|nr:hypothetical protein F383_27256 [Gossypium arboreum]
MLTFVYSDLFLLENQLPFRVLELLTSSGDGKMFMNAIQRFIDDAVINPAEDSEWWWEQKEGERIHLLNLLRRRLLVEKEKPWRWAWGFRFIKEARTKRHTFRNIKELKKAWIWLKASETSCLTDISFKHIFIVGKLWLPPISVDDSTMNLIAYEMCPDFDNDLTVTSYMCFLDSLIDGAADVRELSDAGIVYNGLGSDEVVAKLFNKMNTDLIPNPMAYRATYYTIHQRK